MATYLIFSQSLREESHLKCQMRCVATFPDKQGFLVISKTEANLTQSSLTSLNSPVNGRESGNMLLLFWLWATVMMLAYTWFVCWAGDNQNEGGWMRGEMFCEVILLTWFYVNPSWCFLHGRWVLSKEELKYSTLRLSRQRTSLSSATGIIVMFMLSTPLASILNVTRLLLSQDTNKLEAGLL